MRSRYVAFLVLALIGSACGGASEAGSQRPAVSAPSAGGQAVAAANEAGPERVKLDFHWPHGFSMSVHVTHQRQHDREQARSALTYSVGVLETDAGFRVNYSAYMPYLYVPGALPTEQHGMRSRLAGLIPSMDIDKQGNFVALPGLQDSSPKKRLRTIRARGRKRRLAAPVIGDRGLTLAAQRFWEHRVGRWHGHAELVQGQKYEEAQEIDVPELDGALVPAVTRYELVGRVPCTQGGEGRDCVEIHLETTPRDGAMAKAVAAFQKKRRKRRSDGQVRDVEKRARVQIVTEAATLRPRRYKEELFTMVGLRDRQGNETQSITMDQLEEVYTH